jgi:UDP-N-acetylmuramate dehydrogenase
MNLREQVELAPLTTLGVGGPARYFIEAASEAEVGEAVQFSAALGVPLFVLGGGSNLVVADAGFAGLALKVGMRGVECLYDGDRATYRVAAGEDWDGFVARSVADGCAGIECLSGIPGTIGGTPVQNVGAYGQEVAETILEVEALNRQSLEVIRFSGAECGFGYRTSRFNSTDRERHILLRVTFALRRGGNPSLRYADLQRVFAGSAEEPTLRQVREAVLEIRRSKSMVLDSSDENRRSAGSFFKNPALPQADYEAMNERLRSRGLTIPSYAAGPGMRKLSAAWLVEQAGFTKGYVRGAVGISTRHSLAIVNRGGATAADIVSLKDDIQARVLAEFGIQLQSEPVFLGF